MYDPRQQQYTKEEFDAIKAERDEYHDQYHLCEAKLLSHKAIIRHLEAENKRYRGVLKDTQKYLRNIPNWPDMENEHILDVQIEQVLKESEK